MLAWGGDPEATDPKLPYDGAGDDDELPRDELARPAKKRRYKNGHPGRSELSKDLERVVTEHIVPDDERDCERCGQEMACIKHHEHERIEYVPAKLVVQVDRREILACKKVDCQGQVLTGERVEVAAPRCRIGHSLVNHRIEASGRYAHRASAQLVCSPRFRRPAQDSLLGLEPGLNTQVLNAPRRHRNPLRIIAQI